MTGRCSAIGRLCSDDGVPGERERGHELEHAFTKELAFGERDAVTDDPEADAERDVSRVEERGGGLVEQHVAGYPASKTSQEGHGEYPDHGEVLVVVGPSSQEGAVEGVGAGGDEIDSGFGGCELPVAPVEGRCQERVVGHGVRSRPFVL